MTGYDLVAFLGVSGKEKDGRVQFVVKDSNFHKELTKNVNYKEVKYYSHQVTGRFTIYGVEEISNEG